MASGYILRLTVNEVDYDAAGNYSVIAWSLQIIKGSGSGKYADGPHGWSVNIGGATGSGSIGSYDFRGYSSLLLGSWNSLVLGHNPDGSLFLNSSAFFDDNNTWGELGDASAGGGFWLTQLNVAPGTPTGMTATRVSDTSINLAWNISHSSNGAPTSTLVQRRINGGAWADLITLGNVRAVTVSASPNQKLEYRVRAANSAGTTAFSAASSPIYTTPGAPTDVTAVKDASMDITVAFTPNVAYTEHTHEVWHGTVSGGVTTWDGSVLATLPAGTTSYLHDNPSTLVQHVYRVRSKAGSLTSAYANSNTVQLLAAPNAPTVPAMPAFADKAAALVFEWTHNPVDTTAQTAYEFEYSTNGGSSWTSTGKQVSAASSRTIAGGTYAANVALQTRVRTWGSATTGGADGTGASPWSTIRTVTYKTAPTATITSPTEGATVNDATLRVTVGFSQPEAATFVLAQLELLQGATVLETLESTIQVGITMATPVQNGTSYTIRARVQDSNGLWSAWDSNAFNVVYLAPVAAGVALLYLEESGFGQIGLTIPAPGVGEDDAETVTITRTINGVEEVLVLNYPAEADMTFLDTTPVIHGVNTYKITTTSDLGAQTLVTVDLVTEECRRAFLSKGDSFQLVTVFGANLEVDEDISVASDTVQAAGRTKPIGLYGVETSVKLKVSSFVFTRPSYSTIDELRTILLVPGKACYRDASGRRVFGTVQGGVQYRKTDRGDLSFTMIETS
jgi:hypothetical protein